MKHISNKYKKITVLILLVCCCFVISTGEAFCDSISVGLTGNNSCNIGDTVTLSLTYKGTQFGTAKAEIKYDPKVLQYESCTAVAHGGNGVISISLTSGGSDTLSCMIKFKAIKAGNAYVEAHTIEAYGLDETQYSASTKKMNISVKNPSPSVSSNANLSRLSVSAGSLSPAFSPSRTSYTVNVSNDVKICTLSAATEDDGATYTVSGSKNLSVGKNVRTVTVTAENGATRTYTITIIRAAAGSGNTSEEDTGETDDPQDNEQEETRPEDIKVTINDKDYIVNEEIDENDFPAGFTMTIIQYNDIDIPAIVDMDLNYTLVMLTDPDTGDSSWFFYDEESGEFNEDMKLSAEDVMEYASLKALSDDDLQTNQSRDSGNRTLLIILAGTVVLLAAFIIALQIMILKDRRKRGAKYETEDIKDQEKDI